MTSIRLLSWNINGARAIYKAGFLDWLNRAAPDILCLQETRADPEQLPPDLREPAGYLAHWHGCRRKKGYSGTALLTRPEPRCEQYGLGRPEFDDERRTIIADYGSFVLINCYFPNGSRDLSRVPYKLAFYDAFLETCERLRLAGRGVLFCGDVNTAHREIDLAHPRKNREHTDFLPEERAWLDRIVQMGYVDTFRHFHPDLAGQYTWWDVPMRARERNVGWRIDYFFVSPELLPRVTGAFILPEVAGSDHCPVGVELQVPPIPEDQRRATDSDIYRGLPARTARHPSVDSGQQRQLPPRRDRLREVQRLHADLACALDVRQGVVDQQRLSRLHPCARQCNAKDARLGLHYSLFGRDRHAVKTVKDGMLLGKELAGVIPGVAQQAHVIARTQAAEISDEVTIEFVAGEEILAKTGQRLVIQPPARLQPAPVLCVADRAELDIPTRLAAKHDVFGLPASQLQPLFPARAQTAIAGANQHAPKVKNQRLQSQCSCLPPLTGRSTGLPAAISAFS